MPTHRPKRRRFSPERRKRMARALELRQKGASYRAIAEVLDVSPAQAYDDVQDALSEVTREPAETVLEQELDRLDSLFLVSFRQAVKDGNLKAIQASLNIMERRAKYLGLDNMNTGDGTRAVQTLLDRLVEGPVQ